MVESRRGGGGPKPLRITIYDTVISSEAGDKVFEPGIFLFREVSRFFDGLKNYRRKNFSASLLITVL